MLQEENKQDTGIVELIEAVRLEFGYKIGKSWNSIILTVLDSLKLFSD